MSEENNINIVKEIYACLLNRNIQGILNNLSENVVFKEPPKGPRPFSGIYYGKKGVLDFFKQVDDVAQFISFDVNEFITQRNLVIAFGHYKAKSRITEKEWESDMVEVWKFENNKVTEFQIFKDSAAELIAMPKELAYI